MTTNWAPMTEPEWLESIADLPRAPRCELCGDTEDLKNDEGVLVCPGCDEDNKNEAQS